VFIFAKVIPLQAESDQNREGLDAPGILIAWLSVTGFAGKS
jgi:hypothetical protein